MQAVKTRKAPETARKAGTVMLITIAAGVLSIIVLGFIAFRSTSTSAAAGKNAYFTTDDGATLFVDSADKLCPFDHAGKQACKATVYSLDNGRTKKVAYLERFTAEGKSRMQDRLTQFRQGHFSAPPIAMPGDTELKIPGPGNIWVNTADVNKAQAIRSASLADDQNAGFEILLP